MYSANPILDQAVQQYIAEKYEVQTLSDRLIILVSPKRRYNWLGFLILLILLWPVAVVDLILWASRQPKQVQLGLDDTGNVAETGYTLEKRNGDRQRLRTVRLALLVIFVSLALLSVAVGALLPKSTGLSPDQRLAVQDNGQGLEQYNQGNYDAAISSFTQAIALDPNFAKPYNNRCLVYYKTAKYDQALTDCNKAIALDGTLAFAYNNRCLVYIKTAKYDQALADCNKAIELDSGNAQAYNNRGLIYFDQNDCPRAKTDFQKATDLDGSDTALQENLNVTKAKC